jgi:Cytochrome P450
MQCHQWHIPHYLTLQLINHAAAADTTLSVIHTFFLAMVCFPEVQMKAQVHLDRIVTGRLPDFDDIDNLPYLSALVKLGRLLSSNDKLPAIKCPILYSDGNVTYIYI